MERRTSEVEFLKEGRAAKLEPPPFWFRSGFSQFFPDLHLSSSTFLEAERAEAPVTDRACGSIDGSLPPG